MRVTPPTLAVTGSSGFVGEKYALTAMREGYEVIRIDLKNSKKLSCHQIKLDLTTQNFYNKIPQNSAIIHLASLSTVGAELVILMMCLLGR